MWITGLKKLRPTRQRDRQTTLPGGMPPFGARRRLEINDEVAGIANYYDKPGAEVDS